jgi:rod shape-determining protein MreC
MINLLKLIWPWLATTVVSILLIRTGPEPGDSALQGPINDLVSLGSYPIASGVRIFALWAENRQLRSRLVSKMLSTTQEADILRENDRLRGLLEFRERSSMQLLPSEVIGYSSDEGVRGMLIDRGADDGVKENQAVISPDGLVGRVFRVHSSSAAVQLIGDPNLGVAARLASGMESGIVHGIGNGLLRLDGVPVSVRTTIGDSVVTSNQGGVFPPGILIGYATKVKPSPEGWLLYIELKPSVRPGYLQEVFVVNSIIPNE